MNISQIVNIIEIGSSDTPPFGFDEQHKAQGWPYRTDGMKRARDITGNPRTIIHNPHGWKVGDEYALDMVPILQAAGGIYKGLVDGFAPAMRPLIADGHVVDVYLGKLDCEGMKTKPIAGNRRVPLDLDDRLRRLATSMKPYTDAGIRRVYVDASALVHPDTREHAMLMDIKHGFPGGLGIEARPYDEPLRAAMQSLSIPDACVVAQPAMPHWHGYPVYSLNSDWEKSREWPGASPDSAFTDVVRVCTEYLHQGQDVAVAAIEKVQAEGHWAGIDVINAKWLVGNPAESA
jgi:hypothetical protein